MFNRVTFATLGAVLFVFATVTGNHSAQGQGWFSTPKSLEEFFGKRYVIERQPQATHVTGRRDQIWSLEAEVNSISSDIDRFGKWLQTPEGRAIPDKIVKVTVEAPTQDKYGNSSGHAKLFTLSIATDELRKINYDTIARFTIDFVTIDYFDRRAAAAAVSWCQGGSGRFAKNFCFEVMRRAL